VGEIGIDLHWDKTWLTQQQDAFRQQVRWAKELALPVVIHCRESFEETIAIIEEEKDERLTGVFHCFTGSAEEARRIIQVGGFMLGIGGVITFPKGGLAETMAEVGAAHCVLETDAPYLAPVPNPRQAERKQLHPGDCRSFGQCRGPFRGRSGPHHHRKR
jgi:TatD DNase family protein